MVLKALIAAAAADECENVEMTAPSDGENKPVIEQRK